MFWHFREIFILIQILCRFGATLKSTQKINVNFVNSVYTQLEYDNPDETTFLPKKIVTEVEMSPFSKKKGSKSIIAKRSVDYSNYQFNKPLDPKVSNERGRI
jgi:hypothetical protein